jgi:hypothetical protein
MVGSDFEIVVGADCDGDHTAHPAAYACHFARREVERRVADGALDLEAVRRKIAGVIERLQGLSDEELRWIAIGLNAPPGFSDLAHREHMRRIRGA